MLGWRTVAFVGMILLSVLAASVPSVSAWEVDETATVTSIIDGDTFDCSPTGRIRLGDIDAPEYNEPGYQEAADVLSDLISGQTVYLDIDDVYGTDPYDRWVAVVYVRYNATHLRNVNRALLDAAVAVVSDYHNEFDPSTWPAYVFYPIEAPPPSVTASADPTEGRAPLTVAFTATASGGIPPYSFLWAFGDGSTSSLENPSHTYVSAGTYVVTLTVTDSSGSSTSRSVVVTASTPSSPGTPLPPAGGGPSLEVWTYAIVAAVVGTAGAVIGLRKWQRRKHPPTRLRPRQ